VKQVSVTPAAGLALVLDPQLFSGVLLEQVQGDLAGRRQTPGPALVTPAWFGFQSFVHPGCMGALVVCLRRAPLWHPGTSPFIRAFTPPLTPLSLKHEFRCKNGLSKQLFGHYLAMFSFLVR
jgi:hypothetical protein